MEQYLTDIINSSLRLERDKSGNQFWCEPLVSFAEASDPMMNELKTWVDPKHMLPEDLLPGAKSVIVYYLPFIEGIPKSNRQNRLASFEWITAYVETNKLIAKINNDIKSFLADEGYKCEITPATHNFDPEVLISYWSHRHLAYIAGLGTFGINNMLITEKGTAGRFGSCVKKCVNGALTFSGFDRFKCYEMCIENDSANDIGTLADVCGKCIAGMPCSNKNPVN